MLELVNPGLLGLMPRPRRGDVVEGADAGMAEFGSRLSLWSRRDGKAYEKKRSSINRAVRRR